MRTALPPPVFQSNSLSEKQICRFLQYASVHFNGAKPSSERKSCLAAQLLTLAIKKKDLMNPILDSESLATSVPGQDQSKASSLAKI